MDKEDIIRMAKEARMPYFYGTWEIANLDGLERFAAIVAAHERDRLIVAAECCRVCGHREVQDVQTAHNEASERTILGKGEQV
jgi:hypothetical protein